MAEKTWEVTKSPASVPSGATIQDFIYFEGMYNPVLRFAFTNVLDEDFVSYWNSQRHIVKPHQTVKLSHHLAVKFTKEIVDKLMDADNKVASKAIPAVRKTYEDKVLSLLPIEDGVELEVIKNEFVEQVQRDANRVAGEADNQSPQDNIKLDFDDLRPRIETSATATEPVDALTPLRKPGRPKKQ